MRDTWLKLAGHVLRPARLRLEHCLFEKQRHLEARRSYEADRAKARARCEAKIEAVRAEVFAAKDGVVTSQMTELEREWRRLSRIDRDGELMDFWARVAPSSWIDRKRWRGTHPAAQLDAAIALASDVEGVEAAEAAVDTLRTTLAAWDIRIGARVRWRPFMHDFEGTAALLQKPLEEARDALTARDGAAMVLEHARRLEQDVHEAIRARLPERASLASAIGHAAFVDCVWRASSRAALSNPADALRRLWGAGYALSAIDDDGVTLEIPALLQRLESGDARLHA